MKSAVETIDPTRVKITVEVPVDDLKVHMDAAYAEVAEQVNVPGFRRGKAPARIIDQRVGRPAILERAINSAMPDLYAQAVAEADIKPLGQPEIEITAVPGVGEDAGENLEFHATVDIRPDVNLPELDGLTVSVGSSEVTEEDVDEAIENLRINYGQLVAVDRAAIDGDFLTIDMTATIGDEEIDTVSDISYEIGTGNMLEGLDEALLGIETGGTTTFSAPLAGGEHTGKDSEITVTATAIKERELPELDDDFAQTASEFDTIAELREDMREQVKSARTSDQAIQARDMLLEQLLEVADFPTPTGAVDAEVHRHLEAENRLEDDEHRAEVHEEATTAIRRQLVLDAIAEDLNPEVAQEELIQYLLQMAQQSGQDPNTFISSADANGQIPVFVAELARNKSIALALRKVTVVDAEGEELDLTEFIGSDEEDAAAEAAAGNFIDVTGDADEVAEAGETIEVVDED